MTSKQENLSKTDVQKELKIYMTTTEFKEKIEKIIKDRLKNEKVLEDKMTEIAINVITQLYKTLWLKKEFWRGTLSNKKN